jgi:hypothetical protein
MAAADLSRSTQLTNIATLFYRESVADQAALYGLLAKLRDLGLPLVSVNPAQIVDQEDAVE